jgi:hypothetical protein
MLEVLMPPTIFSFLGITRAIGLWALRFTLIACACTPAFGINPVPTVDQPLIPTRAKPGTSQFTLTVNGAGFVSGSAVNWNGSPRATSFVSSSQLNATILAADIVRPRTASISVSNPVPGGGVSNVIFLPIMDQLPNVVLDSKGVCQGAPMVSGDFNRDGNLDLIASEGGAFSVFLGKGNGTFNRKASYLSPTPGGLVVGDFDGDGKLDMVGVFNAHKGIEVLLGNGDGTFRTGETYVAGSLPVGVAAGDFNEDGKLDLIVANYDNGSGSTVSYLAGNGDGTFQPQVPLNVALGPSTILVGDFNNDGHLDMAVGSLTAGTVLVVAGNGDGTFQTAISTFLGDSAGMAMVAADFNGDGKLDLAVTGLVDAVWILLGDGDGTFALPVQSALPSYTGGLAVGDFNGDGKIDLAVFTTPSYAAISILKGSGDGTFQSPQSWPAPGSGNLVVGDFNNDGRLDVENGCADLQVATALTLSKTVATFAKQTVGTASVPKPIKLTNTGNQAVAISSITTTGDFSQTNNCPASLDVFKGCLIDISFNPTATGLRTGTVTITDAAHNSPQMISVNGVGSN